MERVFDVTAPDAFDVIVSVSEVHCDDLGSISLNVTGGTAPYTFDWNGADPENLATGTYNVVISDINGCTYNVENIENYRTSLCSTLRRFNKYRSRADYYSGLFRRRFLLRRYSIRRLSELYNYR